MVIVDEVVDAPAAVVATAHLDPLVEMDPFDRFKKP
jgi:hypothetical protein